MVEDQEEDMVADEFAHSVFLLNNLQLLQLSQGEIEDFLIRWVELQCGMDIKGSLYGKESAYWRYRIYINKDHPAQSIQACEYIQCIEWNEQIEYRRASYGWGIYQSN